ncbi:bifunctional phosphoglucose/phosphomannose isomerase [Candidatus Woesearchaeota archaeon]|nr:bifunctional phosphoglucose/phosphomannose isomerase [Candidatus Woesearchaeota archaeon]
MTVDKSNLIKVLDDFPRQCREALALPEGIKAKGDVTSVVVCGMGGSAIGGDILKAYCSDTKIPVLVNRDYKVPEYVDEYTLVFTVSYSGNTEETLSAFYDAKKKGAHIIAVTSGGKLSKEAEKVIKIPSGLQPRAALGYLFFPMIGVLYNSNLIDVKNTDLNEMLGLLEKKEEIKEIAEELARKIEGKTPLIYSSELLKTAAYRWQTQINENAKYPAFHSAFSEMNHNEINSFRAMDRGRFFAILLRDEKDNMKIKRRMDICKEIMERNIDTAEVKIKGNSLLARMMYAIYAGDYTSYYLALRERVDPTPVEVIEWLKKQLA